MNRKVNFFCTSCGHLAKAPHGPVTCPNCQEQMEFLTQEEVRFLGKKKGRKNRLSALKKVRADAGDKIGTFDSWGRPFVPTLPTLRPKAGKNYKKKKNRKK